MDSSSVRVQVAHAAVNAPEVDVYVTSPDAALESPLGSIAFKDTLGPVTVASGDYQIRITPTGTQNIVFDSGALSLAGGSDLVLAAIANTTTGEQPVNVALLNGESSSIIYNAGTPASLRVIHASPDAPAVDVIANNNFNSPLVEDLEYPQATGFVDVAPAEYNVKVVPANLRNAVIDADIALDIGQEYSVYALNRFADIEPLVLIDDLRSVSTEAQLRLVHASPTAGNVDIYVTAPNADINNIDPNFSDIPLAANTGYVALDGGSYQVRLTPTGSKTVALDTGAIQLQNGNIYTAVARDAAGGGLPLGLILLDAFISE